MRRARGQLLAGAVLLATLATAPAAQQRSGGGWPGLWGPQRNGVVSALNAPPSAIKQLWRRPAAGGYSEVAIAGDRIYTMEMRDGTDYVVAMDAQTGTERWRSAVGPTYRGHQGSHDGPISTPAVSEGDVFALGPNGQLLAIDAATGKTRWTHDLVKAFGASSPAYGFASSPLVDGALVYVQTGGEKSRGLLAFDRKTGRLAWSAGAGAQAGYSSPVIATVAGTRQLIVAAGDRVFAVAPDSGRELWTMKGPGSGEGVANAPIVLPDDRLLLSFWEEARLVKVGQQDGTFSTTEVWRSPRLRSAYGPTIFRDGFLYGFSGAFLLCLDASNGEVRWRHRFYEGTLVGMGEHLLVLGRGSGNLHVVSASPAGFSEVFQAPVLTPGATSITGPSVAGNRIFLRNVEEIAAFSLEGGT